MNIYRVNDKITITKKLPKGTYTINESDYALKSYYMGQSRYASPSNITYAVTQPTETTQGQISSSFMVISTWWDGLYKLSIEKVVLDEGQTQWTQTIGSCVIMVQKTNKEILL